MSHELPSWIADEVAGWPEFRMGVNRVRVELADGRAFENVMLAGDRVVRVVGVAEIPFEPSDVIAVTHLSDAPLPPGY